VSCAATIHPTAVVDEGAVVGEGVTIGPYSIVGADVVIGDRCTIGPHVVVHGPTVMGRGNRIFQFASVGEDPQDLKYRGERTRLVIGDDNTIRECATLHRGTEGGGGVTTVGNGNLFMAYSHVAHDCHVGNEVVMANGATLAGHVTVEDSAIVGGLVAVHQFTRIGELAMLGGGAMVTLDVPPFCIAVGDRAKLQGLNVVGLRRRGVDDDALRALRNAYRLIFQSDLKLKDALAEVEREHAGEARVGALVRFVERSQRGICREARA
jgi:UDP-N-acetylglucosamine acyltransferase